MKIFVVSLESLSTRYTCEWLEGVPAALRHWASKLGREAEIVNIVGDDLANEATPGAFVNFADTNRWKSEQAVRIARMFANGDIANGDRVLFTDAWNPVVLQVKYMADLLGIRIGLHGIWHAGQYDPQDFLGRLIRNKSWARATEEAIFHALDRNYFATRFHLDLFLDGVFGAEHVEVADKLVLSGQPHEHMVRHLRALPPASTAVAKENLILFPHRLAPEKQYAIFEDLAASMPDYDFVACQKTPLSKAEYHALLCRSKLVFSANLQETLGISMCIEGPLTLNLPLSPDRLSYREVFAAYPEFLYPSEWTTDANAYKRNKLALMERIRFAVEHYDELVDRVRHYNEHTLSRYAQAGTMYRGLVEGCI
jgi:hypothetical protein